MVISSVHGEPAEIGAADTGEISGRKTGQLVRLADGQALRVERLDNPGCQDGAQLLQFGIGKAEIAESVPLPCTVEIVVVAHRNASFSRFSRSWIRSISAFGVLIPVLDFFWNACSTHTSFPIRTA